MDKMGTNEVFGVVPYGHGANENYPFTPWRRWFARAVDEGIYFLVFDVIMCFCFNRNTAIYPAILTALLSLVLLFLLEPLFLSVFGTTPAKWILGMRITALSGEKLSFSQAFGRTFLLWRYGHGFTIPLYDIYRRYKSYKACEDGEILPWDEDVLYTMTEPRGWRVPALIAVFIACVTIDVGTDHFIPKPPNRGELTVAEFVENYNFYLGFDKLQNMHMTEDGILVENQGEYEGSGTVRIDFFDENVTWDFWVEDGILKEVVLNGEMDLVAYTLSDGLKEKKYYTMLATVMAQKSSVFFGGEVQDLIDYMEYRGNGVDYTYDDLEGFEITDKAVFYQAEEDGGEARISRQNFINADRVEIEYRMKIK